MNNLSHYMKEEIKFLEHLLGELEDYKNYTRNDLVILINKLCNERFDKIQDNINDIFV